MSEFFPNDPDGSDGPEATQVLTPVPAAPEAAAADPDAALGAAKGRVGSGLTPLVAQLIALALIGLGAVGVQETLVRTGLVSGQSWISAVLESLDGLGHRNPAALLIGIALVLLGAFLLRTGLRPRPRLTLSIEAQTGVQLRPQDLARLVRTATADIGGIDTVTVRATQRRVGVEVHSISPRERDDELLASVAERIEPVLAPLARKPRLRLGVRHEEG